MDTIWRLKTRGESPDMPVIAAHDTGCQPWGKTDPGGSTGYTMGRRRSSHAAAPIFKHSLVFLHAPSQHLGNANFLSGPNGSIGSSRPYWACCMMFL